MSRGRNPMPRNAAFPVVRCLECGTSLSLQLADRRLRTRVPTHGFPVRCKGSRRRIQPIVVRTPAESAS